MNLTIIIPENWEPFDEWKFLQWHGKIKEEYPMPEVRVLMTKS